MVLVSGVQQSGLCIFHKYVCINTCVFFISLSIMVYYFPGDSDGKASVYSVGDPGLIPESGRSPGEGNGNPLQYSCLENSMEGGALKATVHGVAKSRTRLSDFTLHKVVKFTFSLNYSKRGLYYTFRIALA